MGKQHNLSYLLVGWLAKERADQARSPLRLPPPPAPTSWPPNHSQRKDQDMGGTCGLSLEQLYKEACSQKNILIPGCRGEQRELKVGFHVRGNFSVLSLCL